LVTKIEIFHAQPKQNNTATNGKGRRQVADKCLNTGTLSLALWLDSLYNKHLKSGMTLASGFLLPIFWALSILGYFGNPIPHAPPFHKPASSTEWLWEQLTKAQPLPPALPVLELAMKGYSQLQSGLKKPLLTVIDYSLPSTQKRLWIIDLEQQKILLHTVVAHGRNSGALLAEKFSNRPESYQSSLGFFKTGEAYQGKHGYSLRLDGLEAGINDQARARAIVIHGADYAKETVAAGGRLGRSLGCPAVPPDLSTPLIKLIKEGTLLFIYGKDSNYLRISKFWSEVSPAQ